MKICITVEFYDAARGGGAGMVIREIATRLAGANHDVTVATTDSPSSVQDGVKVVGFNISGNEVSGISGEKDRFLSFLNDGGFDVVMNYAAQSWHTDLTLQAVKSGALKTPAIIAPCGYSALKEKSWRGYFQSLPEKLAGYQACIYHSSKYQDFDFAKRAGLTNSVVIPNGASETEFENLPGKNTFRDKFNIGAGPILLCVANHFKSKGHHFLIEALDQISVNNAKLVLIGGPPGTDLIKRFSGCTVTCKIQQTLKPGRVFNFHNLSRQDITAAYNDADIFVFGSDIECSPLVIIEAMASGTPFLSRPVGNVSEWVDCGRIVQTPSDMAGQIDTLLKDEQALAAMGENGRRLWKQKLTWGKIAKQYETVLTLAAEKRTPPASSKYLPKVSVILPVYNAEKYLQQSLDSILTGDFQDLELIAVNDGSTDSSSDILEGIKDPRLKVVKQDNQGVSGALNTALKTAQGRYIARMDSDDIATADRLSKQVRYLDENPDVDVVGSAIQAIDAEGNSSRITKVMNHPLVIKRYLMEGNCVVHPSVMARARIYEQFGGYRIKARHVEDYDLWARAWPWIRIAALPEPLLKYRIHESQVTRKFSPLQLENADNVLKMIWEQAHTTLINPIRCFKNGRQAASELKDMTPYAEQSEAIERHIAALGLITLRSLTKGKVRIFSQVSAEFTGLVSAAPIHGIKLIGRYFTLLIKEKSLRKAAERMRKDLYSNSLNN